MSIEFGYKFEREELKIYRIFLLIGTIAITAFGFLLQWTNPLANETMLSRYLLSALCFAVLTLTYKNEFIQQHLHDVIQAMFILCFLNLFYAPFQNHFRHEYIAEFIILFFSRIVLPFRSINGLRMFILLVNAGFITVIYTVSDLPFHPGYASAAVMLLSVIGYLIRSANMAMRNLLRESEEGWRSILQAAKDVVINIDKEHKIIYINHVYEGFDYDSVIGSSVYAYTPVEDQERITSIYNKVMSTGESIGYSTHCVFPNGDKHWYSSHANPLWKNGKVIGATIIARDVTENVQAEQRLMETFGRLKDFTMALDSISGVIKTDPAGNITYANKKYCEMTGYSYDELIGKNPRILNSGYHPKDFFIQMWKLISVGKVWTAEVRNKSKEGKIYWQNNSIMPIVDKDGNVKEFVEVAYDITKHRELEASLRKAKEEAESIAHAKTNFLACMSHEIRTPMNAVIGMTGLLLETELTAEQREYVDTIKFGGDSMLEVINEILDFSKIESGSFKLEENEFHLAETIESVLDLVAAKAFEKGIEVVFHVSPDVPKLVRCDSARLRQALLNIVGNSVKFTEQGEVFVSVEKEDDLPGYVMLKFNIADTGIGIPEDKVDQVFNPFMQVDSSSTRKYSGTGLGLPISKKIVNFMGGKIWLESELGKGTVFHFTIRVKPIEAKTGTPDFSMLKGKRVLLVDDNATNLRILELQCRGWGMETVAVQSPNLALKTARESSPRFDLAILDMQMPEMDGSMLTRELRKTFSVEQLPVILLTSLHKVKDHEKALYSAFISKPVKQKQLFNTIADVLFNPELNTQSASGTEMKNGSNIHLHNVGKKRLHILITEDNIVNQKVALRMLEKLGYSADVAGNGIEALDALNFKDYDLIFMDVQMPEMNGHEATRKIRKLNNGNNNQPVIIGMTAHAMQEDRDKCLEAGMNDYVAKPVELHRIAELLKKWFPETFATISMDAVTIKREAIAMNGHRR